MKKSFVIYEVGKRQESYYIVTRAVTAILTLPGKNDFDHLGILGLFDPSLRFHGSETMQMVPDQGPFPLDLKTFRDHPSVEILSVVGNDNNDNDDSHDLRQPLMPKLNFFQRGKERPMTDMRMMTDMIKKMFGWLWEHLRNFVPQPDLDPFDYFLVEFRRTPFFHDYCLESINRFFEKEKKPEAQKNDDSYDTDDSYDKDQGKAKKRGRDTNDKSHDNDDAESDNDEEGDAESDDGEEGDAESDDAESDDGEEGDAESDDGEEEAIIKMVQEEWKGDDNGDSHGNDDIHDNVEGKDDDNVVSIIGDMMNEDILGQILFQSLLSDLIILSGEMNKRP